MTFEQIITNLKKKIYNPIYFLYGKEPYFIDEISSYINNNVLSEMEQGFNQFIFYGKDASITGIINQAKKYPMMANHQVIIVKEAQDLKGLLSAPTKNKPNTLLLYAQNPTPSTILVICYKIPVDSSTKPSPTFLKGLSENSIIFESKPLYDNQIPKWIQDYVSKRGYKIDNKSSVLLAEYIGSNLSTLVREIKKISIALPINEKTINPEIIEKNVGISKDYNIFELQNALSEKNPSKVVRITHYLSNRQSDKVIWYIHQLYSFFSIVLKYHYSKNKSNPQAIASEIGINKYFLDIYASASRNFSPNKISSIISYLREYDLKCKGLGSTDDKGELFKELIMKILYT